MKLDEMMKNHGRRSAKIVSEEFSAIFWLVSRENGWADRLTDHVVSVFYCT